jgi:predicted NAD/FAD-binding protein
MRSGLLRIAVVGTGISGKVAAHLLVEDHDLTIYEADDLIGGHTHTVALEHNDRRYAIDKGFIVFNEWTYPNFVKLLQRLNVRSKPSNMDFSVQCESTGLEYSGTSLNRLFAQRRNLCRPAFYRMIMYILRFFCEGKRFPKGRDDTSIAYGYQPAAPKAKDLVQLELSLHRSHSEMTYD